MNESKKSTLLYLETCLVDQRGRVESRRMNEEDFENIEKFKEEKLIDFGRIPFKELEKLNKLSGPRTYTHWIKFTDRAWKLAHKFRREKAEKYVTTIKIS